MVDAGNVNVDVIPAEGYWVVQQCGKLLEQIDTRSWTPARSTRSSTRVSAAPRC